MGSDGSAYGNWGGLYLRDEYLTTSRVQTDKIA
jgi:hypothetical protein